VIPEPVIPDKSSYLTSGAPRSGKIEVPRLQTDDRSPAVSGRAVLVVALASAGATLLLLRLGSGHTPASRRFAALPEFDVWIWIFAAYVGTTAALGTASFPAFRLLARATGGRATVRAVAAWPVLGTLVLLYGPQAVGSIPLWLGDVRTTAALVIAGVFITAPFAGLLLVQTRLSALAGEAASAVNEGKAGELIVELAWLRTAMLRFLTTFAAAITAGLLGVGALRLAVLAFGYPAAHVPPLRLLTYGGVFTALAALIFIPAYVAWQERVSGLRDTLHPVPKDGRPEHDWFQARDDFDALLNARASAGRVLATAFSVLAPLTASAVSALLSTSR
jgi:hypothetical protein